MDINRQLIEDKIRDAQYVLVGIGEEFAVKEDGGRTKEKVLQAYKNLSGLLDDKSYFIVTLLTDDLIFGTDLKASQIVAPCGSDMSGNVVTNEHYDESCYLPQWQNYLKWLQNTLNRKLCILELGVGFQYPSVIRWPFAKTGYLNKKADFIKVAFSFSSITGETPTLTVLFLSSEAVNISTIPPSWVLLSERFQLSPISIRKAL